MKRKKLLLFSLILICLPVSSRAADINAASCSNTDVQAAIDSAVDGDRVLVPAGNCTWSSKVVIPESKGITLEGAGIGQTVIRDNLTSNILGVRASPSTSLTRVTGFTFIAGVSKAGNDGTIDVVAFGSGPDQFRLDNFEILEMQGTGITVFQKGFLHGGVIDHCTLEMNSGAGDKAIRIFGDGPEESVPFSHSYDLGSGQYVFIEDCTFNFAAREDGALDAFSGARYVFRHNTVNNTNVEHHGADSGGFRGVHSFEIYENTFNNTAPGMRALFFRSGSGVVFNNTWTGNYSVPAVANFRSRPQSFSPWGACDGISIWDENKPGESGYACLDQIGHVFTENSGGVNTLEPLYYWNNTLGGSPLTSVTVSEASMAAHLQDGRDFFSNTQRPGYTPFTYPHPLQGGGGGNPPLNPPTNLRTVVR